MILAFLGWLIYLWFIHTSLYGSPNKVFLAGEGVNAYDLFRSYEINVLAKRGTGYNLGDLKLIIYDGKSFKEFSIAWYDYVIDCIVPHHSVFCAGGNILLKITKPGFIGAWQRMILFSKLHKHMAWATPEIIQIAKDRGWGIYELSAQEREVLKLLKEADPLKGAIGPRKISHWERALRLSLVLLVAAGLIAYRDRMPKLLRYFLITIVVLLLFSINLG